MKIATPELAEQRVILSNISWQTFEQLLKELGDKRATRLAYNEGLLEIMTPLGLHENSNRFIESLIGVIADELNLNLKRFGSLTLKRKKKLKGAEPDSSYYLQNEPLVRSKQEIDLENDPPPDLVLEIDITSGSLDKRPIYAAIGVPELWRYDGNKLEVFVLQKLDGDYQQVTQTPVFPWMPLDVIPRFIRQSLVDGETATLRTFRAWVREELPC
ncbi:MAG: Uma2 family endonuclease [Cyanobacteriota bacterium]|nr:Uma2 family endonuclease [Cyanobacteriota bacterium]